jgi:hypothetical protein
MRTSLTRSSVTVVAAFLAIVMGGSRLRAWGPEAHRIVARIALTRMTDGAKRAAATLLGGEDFAESATWADDVRRERPETAAWHFVNIPYGRTTYDPARDCRPSPRGDCIVAALERERRVLEDPSLPTGDRRDALRFIIHLVGDLHQPLHAIDDHDEGGNDVHVNLAGQRLRAAGRELSLHAVWDSTLLSEQSRGEAAYLRFLLNDIVAHRPDPGRVDFGGWADESHRVAMDVAYAYPGFSPSGPTGDIIQLSRAYQRRSLAAIDQQVELAGLRLSVVLDDAFRRER